MATAAKKKVTKRPVAKQQKQQQRRRTAQPKVVYVYGFHENDKGGWDIPYGTIIRGPILVPDDSVVGQGVEFRDNVTFDGDVILDKHESALSPTIFHKDVIAKGALISFAPIEFYGSNISFNEAEFNDTVTIFDKVTAVFDGDVTFHNGIDASAAQGGKFIFLGEVEINCRCDRPSFFNGAVVFKDDVIVNCDISFNTVEFPSIGGDIQFYKEVTFGVDTVVRSVCFHDIIHIGNDATLEFDDKFENNELYDSHIDFGRRSKIKIGDIVAITMFSARNVDQTSRTIWFFLDKDRKTVWVTAGCFFSKLDEFIEKAQSEDKRGYVALSVAAQAIFEYKAEFIVR